MFGKPSPIRLSGNTRIKMGSIYESARVKFAPEVKRDRTPEPKGLLAMFTQPGDKLEFNSTSPEIDRYGDIDGLHNAFQRSVNEYHKALGRNDVFFIVANRGPIDKANTYQVKYNSRKIKNVPRLGGIKSFIVIRVV